MSSSTQFGRSTEINWRDLNNFSKLRENQEPSIYRGELSDPTSWSEWICCGCCNDKDPERVSLYLKNMNNKISKDLKSEKLTPEECKVVSCAISNFLKLANQYGSKQEQAIRDGRHEDALEYKQTSEELTRMKEQLAVAAVGNSNYVSYAKEAGLLKKTV